MPLLRRTPLGTADTNSPNIRPARRAFGKSGARGAPKPKTSVQAPAPISFSFTSGAVYTCVSTTAGVYSAPGPRAKRCGQLKRDDVVNAIETTSDGRYIRCAKGPAQGWVPTADLGSIARPSVAQSALDWAEAESALPALVAAQASAQAQPPPVSLPGSELKIAAVTETVPLFDNAGRAQSHPDHGNAVCSGYTPTPRLPSHDAGKIEEVEVQFETRGCLGLAFCFQDGRHVVREVVAGSAAEHSSVLIQRGMVLKKVQGQPVAGLSLQDAMALLVGAPRPLSLDFEGVRIASKTPTAARGSSAEARTDAFFVAGMHLQEDATMKMNQLARDYVATGAKLLVALTKRGGNALLLSDSEPPTGDALQSKLGEAEQFFNCALRLDPSNEIALALLSEVERLCCSSDNILANNEPASPASPAFATIVSTQLGASESPQSSADSWTMGQLLNELRELEQQDCASNTPSRRAVETTQTMAQLMAELREMERLDSEISTPDINKVPGSNESEQGQEQPQSELRPELMGQLICDLRALGMQTPTQGSRATERVAVVNMSTSASGSSTSAELEQALLDFDHELDMLCTPSESSPSTGVEPQMGIVVASPPAIRLQHDRAAERTPENAGASVFSFFPRKSYRSPTDSLVSPVSRALEEQRQRLQAMAAQLQAVSPSPNRQPTARAGCTSMLPPPVPLRAIAETLATAAATVNSGSTCTTSSWPPPLPVNPSRTPEQPTTPDTAGEPMQTTYELPPPVVLLPAETEELADASESAGSGRKAEASVGMAQQYKQQYLSHAEWYAATPTTATIGLQPSPQNRACSTIIDGHVRDLRKQFKFGAVPLADANNGTVVPGCERQTVATADERATDTVSWQTQDQSQVEAATREGRQFWRKSMVESDGSGPRGTGDSNMAQAMAMAGVAAVTQSRRQLFVRLEQEAAAAKSHARQDRLQRAKKRGALVERLAILGGQLSEECTKAEGGQLLGDHVEESFSV